MKQKTNKAASKRFKFSKTGKVKRRPVHQSHFNARDSGDEGRDKHGSKSVNSSDLQRIRQLLPYS